MSILIISHANCADGFTAAWLARKHYGDLNCEIIFCNYNEDYSHLEEKIKGRKVLVFDFSFPRELMLKFYHLANSFLVFDHHKTAKKDCEGLDFCTFEMDKSGAMLACEYLNSGSEPPELVKYVQDRDLWTFVLPDSKAINAVIQTTERTYENWDRLCWELTDEQSKNDIVVSGQTILKLEAGHIKKSIENSTTIMIGGYRVPLINNPNLISETVGQMSKDLPFAAAFFMRQDGMFVFSLRSCPPGGIDVSAVAKQYGGGGHAPAAGFTIGIEEFTKLHATIRPKECA